jgi:hypothetical protein
MAPAVLVRDAREIARRWVAEEGSRAPGFRGAFLAGSAAWLPQDAALPATSDVDVSVVVGDPNAPGPGGKRPFGGVLLDVSYRSEARLASADLVLGDYHLAGAFRAPNVLADPAGRLAVLQREVAAGYPRREWVRRRLDHATANSVRFLRSLDPSATAPEQVIAVLFGAGVTTHVPLVAGLRNPTVRGRYAAVRELLAEHGRLGLHEELLALLGSADMTTPDVERHLDALEPAFDAAAAAIRSPFYAADDLTAAARPVAIDGSRELIARGRHREAVFWVAVTFGRCLHVLERDAPDVAERFAPPFEVLLGRLGIGTFAARLARAEQVERFLPRLRGEADAIMDATPGVQD